MEVYLSQIFHNLPSILFMLVFWGTVLSGLVLSVRGLYRKNPDFLALSAVLVSPLCIYLIGANNWLRVVGFLLPVVLVGAAMMMVRRRGVSKKV